jgi:hypothetical protein
MLANVRVLFGLVMTRLSRVGDGVSESMLGVAHLGAAADRQGAAVDRQGPVAYRRVPPPTVRVPSPAGRVLSSTADCQGVIDLVALKPKKLLLREVLIVQAINLNV